MNGLFARLVATIVFVGLLAIAIGYGLASGPKPIGPTISHRHADQDWSWRYPANWHLQTFDEWIGHSMFEGALASNLNHHFVHPSGPNFGTSAWDFRGLPANVVVLQLAQLDRFDIPCDDARAFPKTDGMEPSEFPLSLSDAEASHGPPDAFAIRFLPVCIPGEAVYNLHAWFGPDATPQDWEVAEDVVASIRFD